MRVFLKAVLLKLSSKEHLKRITLTIHTARPGVVIGKGGNEVDKIKEELKKLTNKDVQINIFEIKRPELDAKLVGESIAQQIEARISYKRAMKQAIASAMRVGAEGIKINVQVVWLVLIWPERNNIKKEVFLCILFALISIMRSLKHKPCMVRSVSKYGSSKVRSTVNVIFLLTLAL